MGIQYLGQVVDAGSGTDRWGLKQLPVLDARVEVEADLWKGAGLHLCFKKPGHLRACQAGGGVSSWE